MIYTTPVSKKFFKKPVTNLFSDAIQQQNKSLRISPRTAPEQEYFLLQPYADIVSRTLLDFGIVPKKGEMSYDKLPTWGGLLPQTRHMLDPFKENADRAGFYRVDGYESKAYIIEDATQGLAAYRNMDPKDLEQVIAAEQITAKIINRDRGPSTATDESHQQEIDLISHVVLAKANSQYAYLKMLPYMLLFDTDVIRPSHNMLAYCAITASAEVLQQLNIIDPNHENPQYEFLKLLRTHFLDEAEPKTINTLKVTSNCTREKIDSFIVSLCASPKINRKMRPATMKENLYDTYLYELKNSVKRIEIDTNSSK